jgi:hypothetical protein
MINATEIPLTGANKHIVTTVIQITHMQDSRTLLHTSDTIPHMGMILTIPGA